ncbi:hypothetical protein J6590_031240 [Homalodisca vitripennis]|nr:hypothetical protein J6590_031240 [Homalodisca vitripennis]
MSCMSIIENLCAAVADIVVTAVLVIFGYHSSVSLRDSDAIHTSSLLLYLLYFATTFPSLYMIVMSCMSIIENLCTRVADIVVNIMLVIFGYRRYYRRTCGYLAYARDAVKVSSVNNYSHIGMQITKRRTNYSMARQIASAVITFYGVSGDRLLSKLVVKWRSADSLETRLEVGGWRRLFSTLHLTCVKTRLAGQVSYPIACTNHHNSVDVGTFSFYELEYTESLAY